MDYEEFITQLLGSLSKLIQEDESVHIQTVHKNNGITLTGVAIVRKGGGITPTIYLDEYYDELKNGVGMEEIAENILKRHRKLQRESDGDFSFFTDFDQVKGHIVYRLVNYEQNRERLEEMPHERYLDLAIVFFCHVAAREGTYAAIPIYIQHMKMWKVSKVELLECARKNTPRIFPCELLDLNAMMSVMMETEMNEQERLDCERMLREREKAAFGMYILTNTCKFNGAAVILYPHVLSDFAKVCKGNFYLLPSSVHEVILVPAKSDVLIDDLTEMVRAVNDMQVEAEEFLSDHAYFYDADSQKLLYE